MTSPFKSCACGRTFTRAEWGALPLLGVGFYEVGDAETSDPEAPIVVEECHESRNCPCGSTLSRKIGTTREVGAVFRTMLVEHGQMFKALRAVQVRCTELVEEKRLREKLERSATYGKGVREIDEVSAYPFDLTNRVFGKFARGPADQRTGGPADQRTSGPAERSLSPEHENHRIRSRIWHALGDLEKRLEDFVQAAPGFDEDAVLARAFGRAMANCRSAIENPDHCSLDSCLHATTCRSWEACARRVAEEADKRVSKAYELANEQAKKIISFHSSEVEHLTHAIAQALDVAKMGARNEKMANESCKQIWSQLETTLVVAADRRTGTQHKHSFGPRGTGRCVCGVLP